MAAPWAASDDEAGVEVVSRVRLLTCTGHVYSGCVPRLDVPNGCQGRIREGLLGIPYAGPRGRLARLPNKPRARHLSGITTTFARFHGSEL